MFLVFSIEELQTVDPKRLTSLEANKVRLEQIFSYALPSKSSSGGEIPNSMALEKEIKNILIKNTNAALRDLCCNCQKSN